MNGLPIARFTYIAWIFFFFFFFWRLIHERISYVSFNVASRVVLVLLLIRLLSVLVGEKFSSVRKTLRIRKVGSLEYSGRKKIPDGLPECSSYAGISGYSCSCAVGFVDTGSRDTVGYETFYWGGYRRVIRCGTHEQSWLLLFYDFSTLRG